MEARAENVRVFSAQAEVFPIPRHELKQLVCFLRASGGVSIEGGNRDRGCLFSPRKRRCFCEKRDYYGNVDVFSAQAEVFLMGGGGYKIVFVFSPRKRRCFC